MKPSIALIVSAVGLPACLSAAEFFVATNGTHVPPFSSWGTAATNIQSAVNLAADGDTVTVGDGVYTGTARYLVTVSNSITLRSLNGPEATIIDCKAGTTSLDRNSLWVTATATNALVAGFTLMGTYNNGASTDNKPVAINAGTVSNCVIRHNSVSGGAGGAGITGGRLVDSMVVSNTCREWQNGRGGGIYMTGGLVERCVIRDNESQTQAAGGGVNMQGGTLRNCLVTGNRAMYFNIARDPVTQIGKGAGIRMSAGRVENCTVSGNTAIDRGAGIHMTGGVVSNSIVYFNTSSDRHDPAQRDLYLGGGTVSNSCFPFAATAGNLAADPQFADRDAGDYTLLPGSPCIDAGAALAFADDLNRAVRPIGGGWDIGAYEAPLPNEVVFTCNFSAPQIEAFSGLTVDFTAFVAGADTTIAGYRWDFGDGSVSEGSSLQTVSHTYTSGFFTVTLTVSNVLAEVATRAKPAYVKVHPAVLYVDKAGSHTVPYTSPATAATNIESAVEAAAVGATVVIGDGVWAMAQQVEVEKAIRVRSANGPANCTSTVPANVRSFFLWHTNAVIEGLTLTTSGSGNHAMAGAGAYILQGLVTNCVFRNIVIGGQGAAVWMAGGTVSDCVIVSNRSYEWQYGYGGGVFLANYPAFGMPVVENSQILFNECQSYRGGGGVYMQRGIVRNCLIASNSCTRTAAGSLGVGGGVYMTGGSLQNCTVARNFAVGSGGGLYISGAGAVTNTIVYLNSVSVAPEGERNLYNAGGSIGYSCIDPAPAGTGNTSLDPLFEDAAAYNFHLRAGSPATDQGLNQDWMAAAVDLDGSLRLQNAVVDMGAYESPDPWSGPLVSGFSATPSAGFISAEVVFTAEPVGLDTNVTYYWWTFGNGNSLEGPGLDTVTNTYSAGYYDVTLVMQNASGQVATNSKAGFIRVAPQVAYVSTNGAPAAPYMTWETAAATLQDALTAVGWGPGGVHTIVAVTDGVYTVGAPIVLATNNTILGVGEVSNIVVQGTSSRIFAITNGVTLAGLTIRGGNEASHLAWGAGVYMTGGMVSNCIIRDCSSGGRGGGIYLDGGTVSRCTFITNTSAEWQHGMGGGVFLQNGLVENCVFDRNRTTSWLGGGGAYVAGGLMRNCLLTRNTAECYNNNDESDGGGVKIAGGRLEHCTLSGNWAEDSGGGLAVAGGGVTNCIVTDNSASHWGTGSGNADIDGPQAAIGFSCSPDLVDGTNGNRTADPLFLAPAEGNYRIDRQSPALESGTALEWTTAEATDLDGRPRLLGRRPDMGAYEADAPRQGVLFMIR